MGKRRGRGRKRKADEQADDQGDRGIEHDEEFQEVPPQKRQQTEMFGDDGSVPGPSIRADDNEEGAENQGIEIGKVVVNQAAGNQNQAENQARGVDQNVSVNSLFLIFLIVFVSHFMAFYTSSVVF